MGPVLTVTAFGGGIGGMFYAINNDIRQSERQQVEAQQRANAYAAKQAASAWARLEEERRRQEHLSKVNAALKYEKHALKRFNYN